MESRERRHFCRNEQVMVVVVLGFLIVIFWAKIRMGKNRSEKGIAAGRPNLHDFYWRMMALFKGL